MRAFRSAPRLVLAVLLAASPALAGDVQVKVGHNHLEPAQVTVGVGDSVTWVNQDAMPGGHSVVATDGSFESPALEVGASFTHTFTKPGTFRYYVQEHPSATGTIVVE